MTSSVSTVGHASDVGERLRFSQIVAPLDVDAFLSRFWGREAALLRQSGRTFDEHFGWPGVNAILNAGGLLFPGVKLSRNDDVVSPEEFTTDRGGDRIVDPASVLGLFQEGASFGISGADAHWPPLRSIVDAVQDALLESVHANVYCSPANTQGFRCHYDLHEVFVLQVEGSKHWRVFRPTSDSPLHGWRPEDAPDASAEPYVDVVLRKGDVLYIPRGHWHYAVAEDSISLHVTVGVTCRKGTSFLDWLAGELPHDSVWRRNAPLLRGAASGGLFTAPPDLASWSRELKQSLSDKLSEPDLFERFCREMLGGIRPRAVVSVPLQLALSRATIDAAIFERPAGRPYLIAEGGGAGIAVTTAGSDIQLEGVSAFLMNRILETDSFTLADVLRWEPDVSREDVADLLLELVRSRLLLVRPAEP